MIDIHQKHIWLLGRKILERRVLEKTAVRTLLQRKFKEIEVLSSLLPAG